jgi:hypothetical protein
MTPPPPLMVEDQEHHAAEQDIPANRARRPAVGAS